ncbi:MAG: hypothetical protein QNM02_09120, partial [Acidimicrobiia bacterium]|nr:hypothetical protein [Acidimicrobiia bacterium]
MGLFGRRNADEQIAVLRAELRAMHEQLDTGDRSRTALASEVDRLAGQVARRPDERESTLETTPAPLAPPPAPPTLSPPTAPMPPADPAR